MAKWGYQWLQEVWIPKLGEGEGNIEGRHILIIFLSFLFVCFDSLRTINNLSVKQGRVFLGWTSTKLG